MITAQDQASAVSSRSEKRFNHCYSFTFHSPANVQQKGSTTAARPLPAINSPGLLYGLLNQVVQFPFRSRARLP